MKRFFLPFIIIVCIASLLMRCEKDNDSEGIHWTTYTTEDGLASNSVTTIAIDLEGNKWFGTGGGVSKFDGTNWTNYTTEDGLAHNIIRAIAIDKEGNKWIGYYYALGVTKFDGTTWTTYTTEDGLINNFVIAIREDNNGNKWFITPEGVSKFDGINWTNYDIINVCPIASNFFMPHYDGGIDIDTEGNIWFVCARGGFVNPIGTTCFCSNIMKFDGMNWTTYDTLFARDFITEFKINAQDNKWFGTLKGVSKFDGINLTTYTTEDGLASNEVHAIAIDKKGNKWFGTYPTLDHEAGIVGGGVSKFNGTNWTTYTETDSLASNLVYAIAIDKKGNKWFGTAGGVSKLSGD